MSPVADEALTRVLTSWALPILLAGSIVDCVQCFWLGRRWWVRRKRRLEHEAERKARARLIEEGILKQ